MQLDEREVALAYQRYGHLVLRRCRVVTRDVALADDALQEVFMRLMRYGGAFRETDKPVRWLYRVADRVCFDLLRQRKRRAEVDTPEDLSVSSEVGTVVDRDVVLRFLSKMDAQLQQIAVLHYVDGLTQGEIATEMGISRQTVNKKIATLHERASAHRQSLGIQHG